MCVYFFHPQTSLKKEEDELMKHLSHTFGPSPANNHGSAHTYYNMAAGMYDVFNSCMRISLTFFSVGIDFGRQNLTSVDVSF